MDVGLELYDSTNLKRLPLAVRVYFAIKQRGEKKVRLTAGALILCVV